MNAIKLAGCAPIPLAAYLKALGVLRVTAEQCDAGVRGHWEGDVFVLTSALDLGALLRFLLNDYCPTPVIAPWNGGSGFYPKDNQEAIGAIRDGNASRFEGYRQAIRAASGVLETLGILEKVSKEQKATLLESCRSSLSNVVVNWLDAAFVLTEQGPQYPPLLGTGGNDGRLDFTNNFMQRLLDVMNPLDGIASPTSEKWLRAALVGETTNELTKNSIGQFYPAAAGGANSASGFDSDSLLNPWDFLLMIEGAIVFAGASVKRMESKASRNLSAPFCVRQAGVGYASAALADETAARAAEMWLPLWPSPASFGEVGALMGEGRSQVSGRAARNGVDFTRALATLGVDRGILAFQRYGFQVRNGLAYFATPLDRLPVRRNIQAGLLGDIDRWLDDFRGKAASDNAPASAARSLRQLEAMIIALCKQGGPRRVQDVLIALGKCEQAISRSMKWTIASFIKPIPLLSQKWLKDADDGSHEYRLAAALASVHGRFGDSVVLLRQHLEPVSTRLEKGQRRVGWDEHADTNVVWHEGDAVAAMNTVMARRLMIAVQGGAEAWPDRGRISASLAAIAAFIEGRTDNERFAELLWGVCLLDWPAVEGGFAIQPRNETPSAAFGLLKLCFCGTAVRRGSEIPVVPEIHQRAAAGDSAKATQIAARRLRGSGLPVAVDLVHQEIEVAQRSAAALLFPISDADINKLASVVLRPEEPKN